jgi:aspartate dehydrogenase
LKSTLNLTQSVSTTVGLVGYGRIGQYLAERIAGQTDTEVGFVFVSDADAYDVEGDIDVLDDAEALAERRADLVVEAATHEAVADLGPRVLASSDLLVLSTTALADEAVAEELESRCRAAGTRLYVPHGAVLGTDGLQDGRETIDTVRIETRKNPANLDFSYADVDAADVEEETVLYEGATRGICHRYPRNVNSHATVAVAGLGLDETESVLIADPEASEATHDIVAEGEGTRLAVERSTTIEGVTGAYTLVSIAGTVERILDDGPGTVVL